MAYETGFGLHTAGMVMSYIACPWIPSALPIAIGFTISCSNPGEMEKAAKEWEDAAKKLDAFAKELKDKVKNLPAQYWTSDDKDAFDTAVEAFNGEIDKSKTILDNIHKLVDGLGLVYFILAILAIAIGTFLLALAVLVQSTIAIPFVGEGVIAAANSIAAGLIGIVDPAIVSVQTFVMVGKVILGLLVAALVGTYGGEQLGFGTGQPEFKDVEVKLPNPA